jgi:hypothetical protein
MDIIFHVGAHHTDGGALLRSLLKNGETLMRWNVAVPGPSRYRKTIGTMVNRLRGEVPTADAHAALMEALVDGDFPERIVLSSDSFICVQDRVVEDGRLYGRAHKTRWLRNLFPNDEVAFAIGLRNPAALLSSLWRDIRLGGGTYQSFLGKTDPRFLRWSDLILRIREENPECPVVVWCTEDTPFVWPEVMHILTGIPKSSRLDGEHDMLSRVMQRAGMILYHQALEANPKMSTGRRRAVAMDLLDTYAAVEQVDVEIDLPGWDADLVDEISREYDRDIARVREIPGVVVIEP